jgi:hypothetical protein
MVLVLASPFFFVPQETELDIPGPEEGATLFEVQSIDTMKYSRDLARERLRSVSFDAEIASQMKLIKASGATHAAIDTPYDSEFIPILSRWVSAARKENLLVWFRGNFSGWEGWFGYPKITEDAHAELLEKFIDENQALFEDGDIFSPCPECENGGPGDPRQTGNRSGFNDFITREYEIATEKFSSLKKDVRVAYSMNADIARDEIRLATAHTIGSLLLLDHYVPTSTQFLSDIQEIGRTQESSIGIGEFGSPILDVHGRQTIDAQAKFVGDILKGLYEMPERIPMLNYWTLKGGTTALITQANEPKEVYKVISAYYLSPAITGKIVNEDENGLKNAVISVSGTRYKRKTDKDGQFRIFLPKTFSQIVISKDGFRSATITIDTKRDISTQYIRLERE